jgi:hypothetical protein
MGPQVYALLEDHTKIDALIQQATKDGVFQTSTYFACFQAAKKIAVKYNPKPAVDNTQFKADLLHEVLGKLHSTMTMDFSKMKEFYHTLIGTLGASERYLTQAYDEDSADPATAQNLTKWKATAKNSVSMPHPTYDENNLHTQYWQIETDNMITPVNLIKLFISKSPDKTLSLPSNINYISSLSVGFAEAYFPHKINKLKAQRDAGNNNSGTPKNVNNTDPINFIKLINTIANKGFDNNTPGQNHKQKVMKAISDLVGSPVQPVSGSPLDKLVDHNSFFSLKQLVENKKLD